MKKEKTCAVLYYISAMLFYAAAAINLLGSNNTSTGVVWLCLGSTMLCLGSVRMNKTKKENDETEEK